MKVLEWLGLIPREDTVATVTAFRPPARQDLVTTDNALTIINVYRAVTVLATAAKQLSLDVWRGRTPLAPIPAVIRNPDITSTRGAFLAETVTALALRGNAYWKITRDSRGKPINVETLDPTLCSPREDGRLDYYGTTLNADQFRHLRLMRRTGYLYGLGPIQAARADLAGAIDLRNYAADWFRSGDVPTGILKSDQPLTQDQADQYRKLWEAREDAGVAVMGSGLDYKPIILAPSDAQFLESRQFTKTEIATLFGIPARLMLASVEGTAMTYANIAQDDLTFVRWTLMDYLTEIEDAFTAILPGSQTAKFNLDAVLRPDTLSRYNAHKLAIDAGWMDKDEVRAIEGLAPRNTTPEEGDNA